MNEEMAAQIGLRALAASCLGCLTVAALAVGAGWLMWWWLR